MSTTEQDGERATWGLRARRILDVACGEIRDNVDAIPSVEAALTALRIEAGEVPADAMSGYRFPGESADDGGGGCVCPRELRARGGFKGECPAH